MELLGEHAGRGDYIPVAGNIIGILPPTLYAVLLREWTMPGIVFAGYAVLQIAISNFRYPWLQGRGLALSPLARARWASSSSFFHFGRRAGCAPAFSVGG